MSLRCFLAFFLALIGLAPPAPAQDLPTVVAAQDVVQPAPMRPSARPASLKTYGEWCSEGKFGPRHCIRSDRFGADTCRQIEAEATLHGLPPAFLARLLWQESRFDRNAVSPKAARGIAQFIDGTARLRGLDDPFNPAEAIEKSAEYLGEMTRRYGNVGLAAIGYNGGEGRVSAWIAGTSGLPRETRQYVAIITGTSAETWRDDPPAGETFPLAEGPFQAACEAMAKDRRVTPLAPPPPRYAIWGVQIGYGQDRRSAEISYQRRLAQCPASASTRHEMVEVEGRGPGRPSYIAVRLAADTRGEAARICRALSREGCRCRVSRNPT